MWKSVPTCPFRKCFWLKSEKTETTSLKCLRGQLKPRHNWGHDLKKQRKSESLVNDSHVDVQLYHWWKTSKCMPVSSVCSSGNWRGNAEPLFTLLSQRYQPCVIMPWAVMDTESGKSQDSHTCSLTNILSLLLDMWVGERVKCVSIYGICAASVKATWKVIAFLFRQCSVWLQRFVVNAEFDSWSSDYELRLFFSGIKNLTFAGSNCSSKLKSSCSAGSCLCSDLGGQITHGKSVKSEQHWQKQRPTTEKSPLWAWPRDSPVSDPRSDSNRALGYSSLCTSFSRRTYHHRWFHWNSN